MRLWGVSERGGDVLLQGRYDLESILRLLARWWIAVLLMLVMRLGRWGLDRREIMWVVADKLFLSCEPLAEHRLTLLLPTLDVRLGGVLVRDRTQIERPMWVRHWGRTTRTIYLFGAAGKDCKLVVDLFLLDATVGM
jgi:hypothetical protein